MYICLFVRDMVGWVILLSFLSYFYAHVFPCIYMYMYVSCSYVHVVHILLIGRVVLQSCLSLHTNDILRPLRCLRMYDYKIMVHVHRRDRRT